MRLTKTRSVEFDELINREVVTADLGRPPGQAPPSTGWMGALPPPWEEELDAWRESPWSEWLDGLCPWALPDRERPPLVTCPRCDQIHEKDMNVCRGPDGTWPARPERRER